MRIAGAPIVLALWFAALSAGAAVAPLPIAHKTADYQVMMSGGRASSMQIKLKNGDRIVFTELSNAAADIKDEAFGFFAGKCTQGPCVSTCNHASNVRPFKRMTRYDSHGRKLWSEYLPGSGQSAVKLLSSGMDDCMSPDQKYVTVEIYFPDTGGNFSTPAVPAVIELAPRHRFVKAKGLGSNKDAVMGWIAGRPSTLLVEHDAGVEHGGPPEYFQTRFGE